MVTNSGGCELGFRRNEGSWSPEFDGGASPEQKVVIVGVGGGGDGRVVRDGERVLGCVYLCIYIYKHTYFCLLVFRLDYNYLF
ncbi:hypothetical protein Hanom_Chr11g01037171 [Helianthus anomalus]